MTVFWIMTAFVTASAGLAVLSAARRGVEAESVADREAGARELAELDRLKARGLLDEAGWTAARAEAGRRLLAARSIAGGNSLRFTAMPSCSDWAIISARAQNRSAAGAGQSSRTAVSNRCSQRAKWFLRMSGKAACACIGEPLKRPVISSTEDQKSHSFERWASQSSIAASKIGPSTPSRRTRP